MEHDWTRFGPELDLRPLFPVERSLLHDLLSGLDPADWDRPTVCPGWDVHDLVGHILHDHLRRLSGGRDGHPGLLLAPDETLPAALARANGDFVRTTRQLSPRVLIDLLDHLGPQLDAVWAATELGAASEVGVWWAAPGRPAPVWLDIAREYTEFWVHQQQIRDAVGRPGADDARLVDPVVDTFLRALPHTLAATRAPRGSAVRVVVPGSARGSWTATLDGDGDGDGDGDADGNDWTLAGTDLPATAAEAPAEVLAEAQNTALTEVTIDADTLWRLATRGIEPEEARGRAAVKGDADVAEVVLTILSIIR